MAHRYRLAQLVSWERRHLPRPRLLPAALVCFSTACATVQLNKPLADFSAGVIEAQTVLEVYFTQLNDYERRIYLEERLFDPSLAVAIRDGNKPTPLSTPLFSPESVRVRLDSLQLLAEYAQRLSDLALSDAPAEARQSGAVLGKNLADLGERVANLAGDKTAADYAGPLQTLVAAIGEMWVKHERDAAIRSGIEKGGPAVRRVLNLLEVDVVEAVKALRETGEKQRLAIRVLWYNKHRTALADDLAARRAQLEDIDSAVQHFEAIATFEPRQITGAIREANEALLQLASSPRKTQDLQQYIGSMQLFAAQMSAASRAVNNLAGK